MSPRFARHIKLSVSRVVFVDLFQLSVVLRAHTKGRIVGTFEGQALIGRKDLPFRIGDMNGGSPGDCTIARN